MLSNICLNDPSKYRSQFVRALESLDLDLVFPTREAVVDEALEEVSQPEVVGEEEKEEKEKEEKEEEPKPEQKKEEEEEEKPTFDFERMVLLFELFYEQDPATMDLLMSLRYSVDILVFWEFGGGEKKGWEGGKIGGGGGRRGGRKKQWRQIRIERWRRKKGAKRGWKEEGRKKRRKGRRRKRNEIFDKICE